MFPSVHDFRLSHYGKECVHILTGYPADKQPFRFHDDQRCGIGLYLKSVLFPFLHKPVDRFFHQTVISGIGNNLYKKGVTGFFHDPFVDVFQFLAFGNVILVYHELVDVVRQQFFQLITDVILQFGKWYGFLFIDAFY